ncbi:hypothetical protein A4X06_0g8941 [Tilletia controversa]|uniref:Aminoacyl-tRNA synthetase class Ia domain-containing protein n=1 Tax=Tilletia controversa TaxID=13291 RepID=A0A8X7SSP9_9BASI|nr:hypothetical protein A4X06_0g8941 [Tilletia controversa]
MPLWVSDDYEEVVCIGSIEELERLSGEKNITDLHRDMPYVQAHYPFENKEEFEKSFPANFLSGGIDQTRGWFYTLLIGRDAPVRQGALEERHLLWSRTSS